MTRTGSVKSSCVPTAECYDLWDTLLRAGARSSASRRTASDVWHYRVGSVERSTLQKRESQRDLDTTDLTEVQQRVLRNAQAISGGTPRSYSAERGSTPTIGSTSVPIMQSTSSDPRQGSFSLRGIFAMSTALLSLRSISGSGSLVTELTRLRGARGVLLGSVMLCQCALSFATGVIATMLTTMLL